MYFISFRKVFYRIPEVHNVLIYRILFDRIQSPLSEASDAFSNSAQCLLRRLEIGERMHPASL
jgi:hypothetical protein